ncbi:hypothetical protein E2562_002550 [Oryza meyeriana var. granulata]|uniref:Uncharacterized protein n=1 Tax=Oryza meyeriana var. granulata TaxID=110450 RepID=A0A6G1F2U6_9ORYZ|nr:hypothetical protein E2562_002550 [Oryza meyeriana var. granulata]
MRSTLEQMAGHVVAPRREAAFRATRRTVAILNGSCSRRRKMAVVRLGAGSRRPRRFLATLRRLRLRWVAAMYRRALRRLRACYDKAIKDVLEGAALVGAVRADAGI